MPDGSEPALAVPYRHTEGVARVVLAGSCISFSDRILWILQDEFPEYQFERSNQPVSLGKEQEDGLHLLIYDEDAAEKLLKSPQWGQARVALAFRNVPSIVDGLRRLGVQKLPAGLSLLPMNVQIDTWLSIVRLLLCGETYAPVDVLLQLAIPAVPGQEDRPMSQGAVGRKVDLSMLTAQESRVLPLVAQGKQNKVIAEELCMSEHTLKLHVHHIIAKLGVRNRTEAAGVYLSTRTEEAALR
ncbi:response regulator transcription factor [Paracoccus rhizosphaerae]|uniref:Response regulator transcription factor n=1 Tax=Paracoccus rhizosphaerae TaxID=1133347 RepID=A0ABV6CMV4_9RHOB|nr:response regulator transcription factor [Paracoccus rhizosphaerae]